MAIETHQGSPIGIEAPSTPATVAPMGNDFPYPPTDLIESDGEPLESHWHVDEINLLCDVVNCRFHGREDYYVAGNMFIYFNREQARDRDYRGPDFFFITGAVSRTPMRPYWAVWNEGGRYPDTIIELMSPTTKKEDLTTKKDIYEKIFKTHEYFCYDPDSQELLGWRLLGTYVPIKPDARGWLWCEKLGLWLGLWQGEYLRYNMPWLRFYDAEGHPVPTFAEAARQHADAVQQRADALADELALLKSQRPTP